ncbi:hypothetical protein HMPREF0866_01424 [Ruminococcaceae bacterium D16]|nr:hypothetical protein HMPREF0866_01424 [Ruminococcaceae bacterium D16]
MLPGIFYAQNRKISNHCTEKNKEKLIYFLLEKTKGGSGVGRGKGPGVGLGLLVMCFVLALTPVGEPVQSAGGEAEVEVPVVALTFDDGPRADTTGWLLEQLELREVPATFFMVGSRIPGNEELIRQMKEQGCQIGVHTYDHVDVTGLSQTDFDLQIGKTRTLLREILGEGNYWLRPPYGFVDQGVRTWSDGPIILWSVDPEDWKDHDVERIVASVVERVEDGDVILMHDIYQSSAEAAIRIVDALEEKGFCFVTVEQLMARQGIAPEAGVIFPERP